jgi:myo-inositol-1(or 4)-monophosphatase
MDDAGSPALGPKQRRAAAALELLLAAARLGGEIALRHFRLGAPTPAAIAYKHGDSPVTAADLEVDAAIAAALRPAFPEAGWLSEESEDDPARLGKASLLVLDPIDGTRAFMNGDPCWTVAIALVEDGRPVAGVVHAPALGETFAAALGAGATLNGAPIRAAPLAVLDGAVVAGPRTLVAAFAAAAGFRAEPAPRTPSLAYRLASVAAGRIAIGLASADSHDWDIAAADVILYEAAARLIEAGREVSYNQPRTRHDVLLAAPADALDRLTPALAAALASPGRRA